MSSSVETLQSAFPIRGFSVTRVVVQVEFDGRNPGCFGPRPDKVSRAAAGRGRTGWRPESFRGYNGGAAGAGVVAVVVVRVRPGW